jgi:hypothetical protein
VPYEVIDDIWYPVGERIFLTKIEDGNSVVTILEEHRDPEGYDDIIKYRLIITNEMLGLPALTGGEQP